MKEIDPLWEETKKAVDKKYGRKCIFERCLSISEAHQLKKEPPYTVDRCHIFSRSTYPEFKYNPNNIVPLSRFIHRRMDDIKNPLNGDPIELNQHFYWWNRIRNHSIEKYDPEIDYKEKLIYNI
jgi:hypothetical protein